jgi:hypothetical protein
MSGFQGITSGPSNASGQNPLATPNGLVLDNQNNLVSSVGISGVESLLEAALLTLQEQTALTSISTAQNLIAFALNSWLLNRLNRTLRIKGRGIYSFAGGSTPTITLALLLGATSLASITTAAINTAASTNLPFDFEFLLSVAATGSSAAEIEAHAKLAINITANTPAAAVATYLDTNTAVVGSLNLEQALDLYVTIASSGTLSSAQLLFATVEALGN